MTVAQRFPASRETVEKSAVAKASPRPTSASRNLTQTSAEADCSHCATRPGWAQEGLDFNGLAYAEPTRSQPSIPRWNGQSRSACGESVRNLRRLSSWTLQNRYTAEIPRDSRIVYQLSTSDSSVC